MHVWWSWTGDTTGGILKMKNKRTICLVFSDKPSSGRACKIWTTNLLLKIQCTSTTLWSSWMNPLGSPKPEGHLERFGISECPFGTGTLYGSTDIFVVCGWILVVNLLADLQNLGIKTPTPMISHPITFHHCQKLSIGNESGVPCPLVLKNRVPYGRGSRVLWKKMPVCLGPEWSSPDRFSHPRSFPLSARIETLPPISPHMVNLHNAWALVELAKHL